MQKNKIWPVVSGLMAGALCLGLLAVPVQAEAIAGYHEKTATQEEVVDTWYAVSRGTYLGSGNVKIKRAGTAKVTISGGTQANSICDELYLALYLDESSDNDDYGTIGVYHYSDTNNTSVSGGQADIRVTSGYYYRARGVHTVTEGNVTETTDTCTDALTAL